MHAVLLLLALITASPLVAQGNTSAPLALASDSPDLRLLTPSPPIYPPIARAAHVGGVVKVRVEIGPDGRIRSADVLSGPEILRYSALDSLRHRLYAPVLNEGKPVTVSTVVEIPFDLNAPASTYAQPTAADLQDRKLDWQLRSLEDSCTYSLESNAPPSRQVERCQKEVDFTERLSENSLWERLRAYTYLSTALRRNQQLPEALTAANNAVRIAQATYMHGPAASAAYSVRAEIEAQLRRLSEACADLTVAEAMERNVIAGARDPIRSGDFDRMNQAFAKTNYVPVLRGLLTFHAQVLTAMHKPDEAAAKADEASRL